MLPQNQEVMLCGLYPRGRKPEFTDLDELCPGKRSKSEGCMLTTQASFKVGLYAYHTGLLQSGAVCLPHRPL
ncbi:UNVERIFIED_CONTAM: hypothetical protein FKN15_063395 [Acipenser sinensis]